MSIIQKSKKTFNNEIEKIARTNVIEKLAKQGVDHRELKSDEFNGLVSVEIEILESDTKKVGLGIGIGLLISMLTGF